MALTTSEELDENEVSNITIPELRVLLEEMTKPLKEKIEKLRSTKVELKTENRALQSRVDGRAQDSQRYNLWVAGITETETDDIIMDLVKG